MSGRHLLGFAAAGLAAALGLVGISYSMSQLQVIDAFHLSDPWWPWTLMLVNSVLAMGAGIGWIVGWSVALSRA